MNAIHFEYKVPSAWEAVKTIDSKIKEIFTPKDKELLEATLMVVSELIENAIKYENEQSNITFINFEFTVESNQIKVNVTNPVSDLNHLSEFQKHIQDIHKSENLAALYTNRLQELFANPETKKTQLGLYRIAYEGKFKISYFLTNQSLTVTAIRGIA